MNKNNIRISASNPYIRQSASLNPRIRIIIATGIFPPDIGGPALYSQKLGEEFSRMGAEVRIVTYGAKFIKSDVYSVTGVSRIWPFGARQLIYFLKLLDQARKSDVILAFDSLGAGLPAALAGKFFKKRVIIRLGGDFLWEKFIESGKGKFTIEEFYKKNLQQNFPFLLRLIKFALQDAAQVAFTTEFQRELFISNYGLIPERTKAISNVFEKKSRAIPPYQENSRVILWAGRFLKLKNLDFLLKVFKRLTAYDKNLVLELAGEGPEYKSLKSQVSSLKLENNVLFIGNLSESALREKIINSYFCILPSLSEVSPNFALHCLSLNKPVILTEETGLKEQFPGLMYADSKKEDSFFAAALRLLDRNVYDNYQKFIADIRYQKTWQDLAGEYLRLLQ